MNSIILAILVIASPPTFEAATLDGRTLTGSLAELTAERATLKTEAGDVPVDMRRLLRLTPNQAPKPILFEAGVVVQLTDGTTIRGRRFVVNGREAKATLADDRVIAIPTNALHVVQLQPGSEAGAAEWSRLVALKADSDLLVVRTEDALDYHKGILQDVTEEAVRFSVDGETLPVKRTKVYGLIFRQSGVLDAATTCRIIDSSESRWAAQSVTLDGELRCSTPAGATVSLPLESIVQLDFSVGKLTYLSDLEPDSISWNLYWGGGAVAPAVRQFYAPRFNRGFASKVLRLNGREYGKGITMHTRTELAYRLPERFSRFLAIAGIDDAAHRHGKVRLVVRGDEKVLLETVVERGQPREVDLDVRNVRQLTILADFSDSSPGSDILLLCDARIIK